MLGSPQELFNNKRIKPPPSEGILGASDIADKPELLEGNQNKTIIKFFGNNLSKYFVLQPTHRVYYIGIYLLLKHKVCLNFKICFQEIGLEIHTKNGQ